MGKLVQNRNNTLEHFRDPAAIAVAAKCSWRSFSKDTEDGFNRAAIPE
jgi:hypothetical protein